MFRIGVGIVVVCMCVGCGSSAPPIAGGKPVDVWLKKVEDKDPAERVEAVKKLGNIGRKSPQGLSAIVQALSDSAASVRKEAVFAVVRNWPATREALPALEQMKDEDEDLDIRKMVVEALGNLKAK